jgi:hypothetical protein
VMNGEHGDFPELDASAQRFVVPADAGKVEMARAIILPGYY